MVRVGWNKGSFFQDMHHEAIHFTAYCSASFPLWGGCSLLGVSRDSAAGTTNGSTGDDKEEKTYAEVVTESMALRRGIDHRA